VPTPATSHPSNKLASRNLNRDRNDAKGQPRSLASLFILLSALTASWTGISLGSLNLVDIALAIATILAVAERMLRLRLLVINFWMLAPTLGAFLIVAVDGFIRDSELSTEWLFFAKMLFGTTIVAVLIWSESIRAGAKIVGRLLAAWTAGVAINAAATILFDAGVSVPSFIIQPTAAWRASGLAFHPNSLAFSLAIGAPVMVMLFLASRSSWKMRAIWLVSLLITLQALLLADSRAGLLVGGGGIFLALFAHVMRSKAKPLAIPLLIFAGVAFAVWVVPALQGTRLAAGAGDLSNVGRNEYNNTAIRVFFDNPWFGAGIESSIGVAVPLQLISAGGLILTISYYIFVFAPLPRLLSTSNNVFSSTGLVVLGAILAFSLLQPGITERATYWPVLLLAVWPAANNALREDRELAIFRSQGNRRSASAIFRA